MLLYRIEHKETLEGMWTKRFENELVLEFLSDKRLLNMPMPHDDIYRTDNKIWKTAVADLHMLNSWFTKNDIIEMIN